ncbi:hypothetical protein OG564_10245 [Streptomyces sp. NBC_01280]|uniref:hypothetical protein n=1 Tax=Streptomyces sp. NBC_01280 TaxID=2903810 RepID=UPI002E335370|nr:hypothetical protein [Streptomyces sp. NBC_01280]
MTVSTAHKAKGREWPTVRFADDFRPVPLGNTILVLVCSFSAQGADVHSAWNDLTMPLSIVTALARNLIKVPAAVLRSRVAKDTEVLALRHENAVLRRQIARVRYVPANRIWLSVLSRLVPRERWHQVVCACRECRPCSSGVCAVPRQDEHLCSFVSPT